METALAVREEIQQHSIDWNYNLECFLRTFEGRSPETIRSYRFAIKKFIVFLQENDINTPLPDDIYDYVKYLEGKSDFTKNLYVTVLKRFFEYLERPYGELEVCVYKNLFKAVDVKVKRPPREPVRANLLDRDVKKLRTLLRKQKGRKAERDLLMIELGAFNRLRDKEIANIRIEDIVEDESKIRLYLLRKGRSARNSMDFVFLQPKLHKNLMKYVTRYNIKKYIFTDVNHQDPRTEHLHPVSVSAIISKRFKEARVKKPNVTPHSLRHHFATSLIKKNQDIFNVQRAMGHSNLQSTLVYLHLKNIFDDNPAELVLEY